MKLGFVGVPSTTFHAPVTSVQLDNGHGILLASAARGTHGLSCKRRAGRSNRHQQINDLIWRALKRCDIPAIKVPWGLLRDDGKRPDGLTLIP